ncbi:hypothetical protein FGIG_06742 [Fasciola gigantica]|uniref:Uncharacterized protein n=1 Tax=Fasciola gigantica TaxID=46835 RepID=A0A504ZEE7_FASGI|nr:hypothetical protein FGIG_06742 [Fasciola gigantica]
MYTRALVISDVFQLFVSRSLFHSDAVEEDIDQAAHMRVTLLNSHGEALSGTLLGLHEHFIGLLCLYVVAIALVLYLIRVSSCCTPQPAMLLTSSHPLGGNPELGYKAGVTSLNGSDSKFSFICPNTFCRHYCIDCGTDCHSAPGPVRTSAATRIDGQTKRLQLLALLIFTQLLSFSFVHLELSRFSNTTEVTFLNHPVAGADGPYGHVAELCSLISHYALLALLIVVSLSTIHGTDSHTSCCDTVSHVHGFGCPVPSISTFRCIALASPHRLNSILLFTQCFLSTPFISLFNHQSKIIWYLMREGVYWQATYAPPEIWPYEEKHAFWAGWGLPNNNYLTADPTNPSTSSIGEGGVSRSSWFWILWDLFSIYSPVSVLLFFARSLLGLFLATSLLRASRVGRVVRFRDMQSRFSMVGFTWFLSYPFVGLCAFLLAEHIRYKLTVVGITLIQTGCLVFLLAFLSRQTLYWDISSLSASLPPLKGSLSSGY